jgi:DNA-binding transcriptional regulator GbsR (MarR family)
MGSTWGVNRTVAQIYAILYLSPRPLTAEEISEGLAVARSTVSTGLHELQLWGIVHTVHVLGDRRDRYETIGDTWEMFRAIATERKRREIDPTLAALRDSVAGLESDPAATEYAAERVQEMLEVFETISDVYDQVENVPTETLVRIARLLRGNLVGVVRRVLAR